MLDVEKPQGPRVMLGFAALALGFAVDLYFDARGRDLFSWMDPYQYFDFALSVFEGRESYDRFEIPSIFPFFVIPLFAIEASVRAALWINFAAMLLMLVAVRLLCRELEFKTPAPLVALLVLSSPMLLGLSRTLYVEFTLAALMALTYAFWLRLLKRMDLASGLAFGGVFAIAFMTKLTLPVFMIFPVAGATLAALAKGDFDRAMRLVYAAAVPVAVAIAIHVNLFAPSLGYYFTVASTSLPFMFLMGPTQWLSWPSVFYYFNEVGETFLYLLTPFLGLSLWRAWPRMRATRLADLGSSRAALWLWLLGPLLILILHPLKEPRHVAASIVPAVLLVVQGIEELGSVKARRVAMALAVLLACVQYALVTSRSIDTPYFMDGPMQYAEVKQQVEMADDRAMYEQTPVGMRELHRNYNRNTALIGFAPNEALALTWQAFPGVTFDLETFDDEAATFEQTPYEQFEDLFFLAGINTYNRRCDWHVYQHSLGRDEVLANADIVIVNNKQGGELTLDLPDHVEFAIIVGESGQIHLLRAKQSTVPYRSLYARNFLSRHQNLENGERYVIAKELLMAAALDGDSRRVRAIQREFRGVAAGSVGEGAPRNIYWIGGYPELLEIADKRSTTRAL